VIREAGELLRLRALRVQRLRARCAEAQVAVDEAMRAVRETQQSIAARRQEMAQLSRSLVHELAPALPRWHGMAAAERERLADRLERLEVTLIDDEEHLEALQEKLQKTRAELTRALAGEDAVRSLRDTAVRERARAVELRGEVELEDQGRRRG
jgi:flagellar biosynthesis chaperone FliJ